MSRTTLTTPIFTKVTSFVSFNTSVRFINPQNHKLMAKKNMNKHFE